MVGKKLGDDLKNKKFFKYLKSDEISNELALERTRLAEERTQLAYIRTGMNLALAGIFFIGYFEPNTIYADIGYITIMISVIFTGYGFYKHRKVRSFFNKTINGDASKKKE